MSPLMEYCKFKILVLQARRAILTVMADSFERYDFIFKAFIRIRHTLIFESDITNFTYIDITCCAISFSCAVH